MQTLLHLKTIHENTTFPLRKTLSKQRTKFEREPFFWDEISISTQYQKLLKLLKPLHVELYEMYEVEAWARDITILVR